MSSTRLSTESDPKSEPDLVLYDAPAPATAPSLSNSPLSDSPYPQPLTTSTSRHRSKRTSGRSSRPSLFDEVFPTPAPNHTDSSLQSLSHVIRRSGSVAIIIIFLLSTLFLAMTRSMDAGAANGLGVDGSGWGKWRIKDWFVDLDDDRIEAETQLGRPGMSKIEFEQYMLMHVVNSSTLDVKTPGRRVIFVGDIHGSYQPLIYNHSLHSLIHVGDLVAKGNASSEVVTWMREHGIPGVRGNHDQPVIQWRAWMEWAGGSDWKTWVGKLPLDKKEAITFLESENKMYPEDWQWGQEHFDIAWELSDEDYRYLSALPLTLHMPTLHAFVVHAGLLPANPLFSSSNPAQPLVIASDRASKDRYNPTTGRETEELSLLSAIPQNRDPWTLINMRGLYESGPHEGKVTKSSKKGTPWSKVWNREMMRCKGQGAWWAPGMGEYQTEKIDEEQDEIEEEEDEEIDETIEKRQRLRRKQRMVQGRDKEEGEDLKCSPVTVVYGHAAGRNLDIKEFSKGIDTGCVYGRQLTALVIGDIRDLRDIGRPVRLGDVEGMLVDVECGK